MLFGCWRRILIPTTPGYCSIPCSIVPIAAVSARERQHWKVLDAAFADDFAYLTRLNPGDLAITGMSQDRQNWLVAYYGDDKPLEYFHYDRTRRQARRLFSSTPALEGAPLVKVRSR